VVGCADDGSGHVPHERGAVVAAADLTMAAAKKWGTNGGMEAKGMMAKGRNKKEKKNTNKNKEKLTMVSAVAELTQQLLFTRV